MSNYRVERDLVGELKVPQKAYYGIHTLRAVENFPISGDSLPCHLISAITLIKKACAITNMEDGKLEKEKAEAIIRACDEVLAGKYHDAFLVDPIQGGAGTSTNMNANEVIANRAIEILGGIPGDYSIVNPNDHVNMGQSTNDVYPSAVKLALFAACTELIGELERLISAFEGKANQFNHIVKIGRTQLQDAVPIRLGQEFGAYAAVVSRELARLRSKQEELLMVNLGGTAIGTGLNASKSYIKNVVPVLSRISGLSVRQNRDLIDGTQNIDVFTAFSGALKGCAISLSKICNDLRLMSSGPRCGLGEIHLPARQNGSSIMPGKVNPVIPEVINQIAFKIIGFDTTVSLAVEAGQMELNAFEPIVFDSLYHGIMLLKNGVATLIDHCVSGITADEQVCRMETEQSVSLVTALCPYIGYNRACDLAKEALAKNKTLKDIVKQNKLIPDEILCSILDAKAMTGEM